MSLRALTIFIACLWMGFGLIAAPWALADGELRELFRGARATAMGNAYTAIADDEESVFMNPAGLAGVPKFSFNYAPIDIEASTDLATTLLSGQNAFASLSGDSLNQLMGKNIYGRLQFAPTFVMPNFGLAVLVDGQSAVYAKNQALPQIKLGYQTTNGVQAGYGVTVARRKRFEFRVGVAGKMMFRRGGYHLLPLVQVMTVSRDTLGSITGNFGRGYGADLGMQAIYTLKSGLNLYWGLAWTDIGDTTFGELADSQKNNLSMGVAAKYSFGKTSAIFSYDYRHMLADTDWRKKNHFGVELALPLLSIMAGVNQTSLTYGVALDAWIFKVTAVSYAEELGSFAGIDSSRRYLLRTSLKIGL